MTIKPEILDELLAAWIQHPEPTGLKVITPALLSQHRPGHPPKRCPKIVKSGIYRGVPYDEYVSWDAVPNCE